MRGFMRVKRKAEFFCVNFTKLVYIFLPKRKHKETTFVGMLFMRTKLVFVLLTNYYQLFHAFFNEIDTSGPPETSLCTEII